MAERVVDNTYNYFRDYDKETGLHYNYFRDYDSSSGRYVESDPIGLKGGSNLYSYVDGNPLSRVDPFGLAYFGYRPLSGAPWLGPLSNNPLDNAMHTAISHEQLFFEDSKKPSNIGFFGDSTLKTEGNPQGYHRIPGSYNDCLMRKAIQNIKLSTYHLLGNNCQNWAASVQDEYKRLINNPVATMVCGVQ